MQRAMERSWVGGGESIRWTEKSSRGKGAGKFRLMVFFAFFLLGVIGGSLFYVWSRIQVIQLGYEISTVLKEERTHSGINRKLRLEIATLKSYSRIEKLATEELGMIKPQPSQVIVIR